MNNFDVFDKYPIEKDLEYGFEYRRITIEQI